GLDLRVAGAKVAGGYARATASRARTNVRAVGGRTPLAVAPARLHLGVVRALRGPRRTDAAAIASDARSDAGVQAGRRAGPLPAGSAVLNLGVAHALRG